MLGLAQGGSSGQLQAPSAFRGEQSQGEMAPEGVPSGSQMGTAGLEWAALPRSSLSRRALGTTLWCPSTSLPKPSALAALSVVFPEQNMALGGGHHTGHKRACPSQLQSPAGACPVPRACQAEGRWLWSLADTLLGDFLLTYTTFMSTSQLCRALLHQYPSEAGSCQGLGTVLCHPTASSRHSWQLAAG